jgi:26S proteasome regulatory subunit N2
MAYCGTSNTKATKLLLSFISSDVSDDVKRSAVISLGFLFINNHSALPQILNMLVISYNAHVRYGTAMALGISGAGKGNQETLLMLEPMLNDTSDFVR